MDAKQWVVANFLLLRESPEGFHVCAANGEQAFIPMADAEAAVERLQD